MLWKRLLWKLWMRELGHAVEETKLWMRVLGHAVEETKLWMEY